MTKDSLNRGSNLFYEIGKAEEKYLVAINEVPDLFWHEFYDRYKRKEWLESIDEERRQIVKALEKQLRDVVVDALIWRMTTLKEEFESL